MSELLADIEREAVQDPWFWQAAPLLRELVQSGLNFAWLNAQADALPDTQS